ncbi:transposase [Aurantimonas sp. VKM B-3413]|uniref:transposase n=1 Tax=Aurantimonas sp. VKM B-3413 TaxID=2779401 RepID=UPI001E3F72DB|nr:transposase [Aurantimonas sp. VKM B-3413]
MAIERIKPGRPQQNGRHERMHLTLKKEATRPPGMNILQQQAIRRFHERIQRGAAARGTCHEHAERGLFALVTALRRPAGGRLPIP